MALPPHDRSVGGERQHWTSSYSWRVVCHDGHHSFIDFSGWTFASVCFQPSPHGDNLDQGWLRTYSSQPTPILATRVNSQFPRRDLHPLASAPSRAHKKKRA